MQLEKAIFLTFPSDEICNLLGVRRIAMSVSLCMSVLCLSVARTTQKLHVQTSRNFLYVLPVAVARSSSEDNAMRYVLPFL